MSHLQYPIKCMGCGLHFVVLSWYENWPQGDEQMGSESLDHPVCPQCASDALMRWTPAKLEGEIFDVVPGRQNLVSMGALGGKSE